MQSRTPSINLISPLLNPTAGIAELADAGDQYLSNQVIATLPGGQACQALVFVPQAVPKGKGLSNLVPLGSFGRAVHLDMGPSESLGDPTGNFEELSTFTTDAAGADRGVYRDTLTGGGRDATVRESPFLRDCSCWCDAARRLRIHGEDGSPVITSGLHGGTYAFVR